MPITMNTVTSIRSMLDTVIFLIFFCGIRNITALMGYKNPNIDLTNVLQWIFIETDSVTLSECLMLCQRSTPCRGIMYQRSTEGCKLSSYDYTSTDAVAGTVASFGLSISITDQTSWEFYHVVRDCDQPRCLHGYTFVAEVCFCLKFHQTLNSYSGAVNHCKDEGGELIKIDNEIVQTYVARFLDQFDLAFTDRVYIQGRKINTQWKFDNGAVLQYFKWAPYQPNNNVGEVTIFLSTVDNWQWQDGGLGLYYFLCKLNI